MSEGGFFTEWGSGSESASSNWEVLQTGAPDEPAEFPEFDVALDVAELVDDLCPDIPRAGVDEVNDALAIVAQGLAQCAGLKALAGEPRFADQERVIKKRIREQKTTIIRLRGELERRLTAAEKEAEAWKQVGGEPGGFASWGMTAADATAAAKRRADMEKLRKETDDYVNKLWKQTRDERARMWEKQNEEFLRYIRGRRW